MKIPNKIFISLCVLLSLTACVAPLEDGGPVGGAPAASAPALVSQNGIEIRQAILRLPGGGTSGVATLAGYMLIQNTGSADDSLIGVQADFAEMSMLHESLVDSNGVASMNMLDAIPVPAGGTVELKPGGLHIMFVGLKRELKVGETVSLVLQFKNAGLVLVAAQVTDQ